MPGNELVQSLLRGLDLVRLLAESDGGMTLSDMLSVTGLKRSTCRNLLRTLESREFVTHDNGLYRIGSAVHMLAGRDSSSVMLNRALAAIRGVKERLPYCIVSFCEPIGGEAIVRFRYSPGQMLIERNCNVVMSPYQTASGLGMLAYGGAEYRQLVQHRYPFELHGVGTWETEEALERFLEKVRASGQVLPPFCNGTRFTLAAVPTFSARRRFTGMLGAAWHSTLETVKEETQDVLKALHQAADEMGTTGRGTGRVGPLDSAT